MISNPASNRSIKIGNKYLMNLNSPLGHGSFGQIYSVTKEPVAIKAESGKANHHQLKNEAEMLDYLQGGEGIPHCYFYMGGKKGDNNLMVMEMLGPSLEDIKSTSIENFTLQTVLLLADQMINRIEYLHIRHIIHRDIKPDNFLMGLNEQSSKVYLIDFGLAKRFRDPRTGDHIQYKDGKSLTGTARYSSTFTLLGIEQSRRDDLEALMYSLIYLRNGQLPWQGLSAKAKQDKYQKILEKKINTSSDVLCAGLPENFKKMFEYINSLHFEERPDYSFLRNLIKEMFDKFNFEYNMKFDWVNQIERKGKSEDDNWLSRNCNENNNILNHNHNDNHDEPQQKQSLLILDYNYNCNDINSLLSLNEEEVFD